MVKVKQIDFIKDRKQRIHAFKDAYSRQEIEKLRNLLDSSVEEINATIDSINTLIDGLNAEDDEIKSDMQGIVDETSSIVSGAMARIEEVASSVEEAKTAVNDAVERTERIARDVDEAVSQFTLDNTLSVSGQAAEAAAVGTALNSKLDKSSVVNHTNVTELGSAADATQMNPNVSGSLAYQVSEHEERFGSVDTALNSKIPTANIRNRNDVTGAGYVADARQLNPNVSGSLAETVANKLDKANVVNVNTTTAAGYAADARQLNPNVSGSLAQTVQGKLDKTSVVNNGTTTQSGYALDARYGKTLADEVASLNSRVPTVTKWTSTVAAADITLNAWTNVTSIERETGYLHIVICRASFGAPSGRYVINQTRGLQSECTQSGSANAVSGLNVNAFEGDNVAGVLQYYFTVRPTSAVAFQIDHIKFQI